jgi:hypothetical protein
MAEISWSGAARDEDAGLPDLRATKRLFDDMLHDFGERRAPGKWLCQPDFSPIKIM